MLNLRDLHLAIYADIDSRKNKNQQGVMQRKKKGLKPVSITKKSLVNCRRWKTRPTTVVHEVNKPDLQK